MAAKKKRRTKKIEYPVCYLVEIENWDWSFSFGMNSMRREKDPYSEFRHLEVTGRVLNPKAVIEKAPRAELTFLPDVDLEKANRLDSQALGVGSLRVDDGVLQGLLSMPMSALEPVLTVLASGRMKYIVMDGPKLRYQQSLLHHYSIDTDIDPDEHALDD